VNPSELIADLPIELRTHATALRIALRYFADHIREATLNDGSFLSEITGFERWHRELAQELLPHAETPVTYGRHKLRLRGREIDRTCPRCGHVHEGEKECGAEMGRGTCCRCDLEVPA